MNFLIITDNEKWHLLILKELSALLHKITSKDKSDCYCINCGSSFRTRFTLKSYENVCKDHDYWRLKIPKKNNNILKYNQGGKSLWDAIDYPWWYRIAIWKNIFIWKKSLKSTAEITQHTPGGYSLGTYCSLYCNKSKHSFYRGADCTKKSCADLRNHGTKIIKCEEKEITLSTKKTKKRNRKNKSVIISVKKNLMKMKNTAKFEITVSTQKNLGVLVIICVISDLKHQDKFLWSSIMILIKTITS